MCRFKLNLEENVLVHRLTVHVKGFSFIFITDRRVRSVYFGQLSEIVPKDCASLRLFQRGMESGSWLGTESGDQKH